MPSLIPSRGPPWSAGLLVRLVVLVVVSVCHRRLAVYTTQARYSCVYDDPNPPAASLSPDCSTTVKVLAHSSWARDVHIELVDLR
jgi:hypothetical protein